MFNSQELNDHLKYSHVIESQQAIWLEINMNQSYNIDRVGNYRYRPGTTDPKFSIIKQDYDPDDVGGYYTGATDSDIVVNAGFDDSDNPAYIVTPKKKINLLYSLDDCFKQNRPRSGINKLLYLGAAGSNTQFSQYIDGFAYANDGQIKDLQYDYAIDIANRPRYYMASRYDTFKYWTSYRTEAENNVTNEYGISIDTTSGDFYIYDAVPFVVYKEKVPANRVIVKVQTNVGQVNRGPFRMGGQSDVPDPLYGDEHKTTPKRWSIQKLDDDGNWTAIISFEENSLRSDGSPIIGTDGYVELHYGLNTPSGFEEYFTLIDEIYTTDAIPYVAPYGYAYLYKESLEDIGVLYVSDGGTWQTYTPSYGWSLESEGITKSTKTLKNIVNPKYYVDGGNVVYREFDFIGGLRMVVDTMNKINSTLDLIEMSPRIVADVSDNVVDFSITKTLSDLATNSMPTGALLASTGSVNLFDEQLAFNANNVFDENSKTGSILAKHIDSRIKFVFYDIVKNINNYDYYVPIKSLYSENFPQTGDSAAQISLTLRDLFLYLEAEKSPELLLTNVSLSYAISILLDNIGFSNYVFKRTVNDDELIIPYFFVGPEQNVAETLQQLAISSQSAIFFDEYNNLVIMSKNYMLPSETDRPTDIVLYGQEVEEESGIALPNIIGISSQEKKVYNGGEINYTTRYIQRSLGSINQAPYTDEYKSYIYKPVLLWEVAGQESTKTINESASQSSGYSLSAMPLKTTLTSSVPEYVNGEIINNVLDFGESIYWLGNYAGYFYANGEIIKYDAVEYSVAGFGNVWIKSNQEYQNYFSKLLFNGKMYPTGRVRIYTGLQGTQVKEHGRGQFGTEITEHLAGIEGSSWVSDDNVRGCIQDVSDYIFNTNQNIVYPDNLSSNSAGKTKEINGEPYNADSIARKSTRNGIIKNFMANTNITESDVNYYKTARSGSVQTSALVFNGPTVPDAIDPAQFVSYVYKPLERNGQPIPYRHFGTRLRIIGKIESGTSSDQSPVGAFDLYPASEVVSDDPSKQVSISGGSGGMAFGLNKETNVGYYFEIAALTQNTVSSYKNNSNQVSYSIVYNAPQNIKAYANNDLVTITLSSQHDFNIGSKVVVAGLTASGTNRFNGEFSVTAISQDRKQFQYQILAPTIDPVNVTGAVADGTKIVYTADSHNYSVGQEVTISGLGSPYDITGVITAITNPIDADDTFTIASTAAAGSTTGTATATYVPFTAVSTTAGTVTQSLEEDTLISNVFFYKVVADENGNAIPEILWRGFTEVIVDDGKFTSQSRLTASEKTSVYDLSAEFLDVGTSRNFYLYINNKQVASVVDTDPLPQYNSSALFVRGASRLMFEYAYALSDNLSQNNARSLQTPVSKVFGDDLITESEAISKYAISGMVQNTYLSGISSESEPQYDLYYEEFGTIMREAAYFNIKYDRAYPALYAKLAETLNRVRGYTVSGFLAGSYGAEFLIFNAIDKNINLDDTSGNYLRILGIAFTQNTTRSLKVDDFFKKNSNFVNALYDGNVDAGEYQQLYSDIQNSRNRYGSNQFTIDAEYIQTDAAAESMMDWIIKKVIYPRKTVGVSSFATQNLQLGDIVTINYSDNGIDIISPSTTRYVVYNIENSKSGGAYSTTVHLAEV